jgi:hypothetical protein
MPADRDRNIQHAHQAADTRRPEALAGREDVQDSASARDLEQGGLGLVVSVPAPARHRPLRRVARSALLRAAAAVASSSTRGPKKVR